MFLFCNEDKKKKERLNSVLKTTHNLIKKNDIKDVRKNPVYSLIRAMSNYHLYDLVPTYDYMYFDGIYFRNKMNDEKLYKVARFEIGALYEIGRILAENGIR